MTAATLIVLMGMLYVAPVSKFFKLTSLTLEQLLTAGAAAIVSVMWFEIYKLIKRSVGNESTEQKKVKI